MSVVFTGFIILTPLAGILLWIRNGRSKADGREFMIKYQVLLNLLTHRGSTEIVKAKAGVLSVNVRMKNDVHRLTLEELDERLVITWKQKSRELGKASREWSFNPSYSQNRMYEEVLTDIKEYQLSLIRSRRNAASVKLRPAGI